MVVVCDTIAQPHPPQCIMPPESSQNLRPAFEFQWLSFRAARAASTHSPGTPESGTGTAIHSSRSLGVRLVCFLYSLPFLLLTEICVVLVFLRLNHQMP